MFILLHAVCSLLLILLIFSVVLIIAGAVVIGVLYRSRKDSVSTSNC